MAAIVLSIDILFGERGDLTLECNIRFWEALIVEARVGGLFGGARANRGLQHVAFG